MDRPDSFLADSDVEPVREPTMQKPSKRTTSSPSHPLVSTLACGSRKAPKAFECLSKSDRVWSIKSLERDNGSYTTDQRRKGRVGRQLPQRACASSAEQMEDCLVSRGLQVCNRRDARIVVRNFEGTDISKQGYEAIPGAEHTFSQISNSMLSPLALGNATSNSSPDYSLSRCTDACSMPWQTWPESFCTM